MILSTVSLQWRSWLILDGGAHYKMANEWHEYSAEFLAVGS